MKTNWANQETGFFPVIYRIKATSYDNPNCDLSRFEPKRVVEQLRACGVLETIRISAAGFPSR